MDEVPDRANVIVQFLREGQRFANQPPDPLAKRVVQALNMGCLATLLAHRSMTLGWKDATIGFPEIAITDRTLAVDCRQGRP
jgi:hypothetical protein